MNDTRVSVLTPPGTGAVATIAIAGPNAWDLIRQHFRPVGSSPLPERPALHRFWLGTLGDEVVLAVKQVVPEPCVEIHCHGGRRVVQWIVEQLCTASACGVALPQVTPQAAAAMLPYAPTLRTASIVLDQVHGACERVLRSIVANPEQAAPVLARLAQYAPVGRHLVVPWKVVIAGPPNVGKSSLLNALTGYQRAVVSAVAGTTRDIVTVPVAFDGWPVELADTAGLREVAGLEREGIHRAEEWIRTADLVVWVMDATAMDPAEPDPERSVDLMAINKTDLPATWDLARVPNSIHLSAVTGEGIPELVAAIVQCLVPHVPPPGAAVPYTPQLADAVEVAHGLMIAGRSAEAAAHLRAQLIERS